MTLLSGLKLLLLTVTAADAFTSSVAAPGMQGPIPPPPPPPQASTSSPAPSVDNRSKRENIIAPLVCSDDVRRATDLDRTRAAGRGSRYETTSRRATSTV